MHPDHVRADAVVVMPNHIHGILVLQKHTGARYTCPDQQVLGIVPLQKILVNPLEVRYPLLFVLLKQLWKEIGGKRAGTWSLQFGSEKSMSMLSEA